jgi:hypothetical protein
MRMGQANDLAASLREKGEELEGYRMLFVE